MEYSKLTICVVTTYVTTIDSTLMVKNMIVTMHNAHIMPCRAKRVQVTF